jgi:hypothetical protein
LITDLILARREIEALKLENAHCRATCDELCEELTRVKTERNALALELENASDRIELLEERLQDERGAQ